MPSPTAISIPPWFEDAPAVGEFLGPNPEEIVVWLASVGQCKVPAKSALPLLLPLSPISTSASFPIFPPKLGNCVYNSAWSIFFTVSLSTYWRLPLL